MSHRLEIIGSRTFRSIWDAWTIESEDCKGAQTKLEVLMDIAGMGELTGEKGQTKYLLQHFSRELTPHDSFWTGLARLVQTAFPHGLVDEDVKNIRLARLIHQFRYVIDAQQVEYIRTTYGQGSDEEKLAQYIREMNTIAALTSGNFEVWSTEESDRLHQKHIWNKGIILFPRGMEGANIKITYGFHTEFILQSAETGKGMFAFILDTSEQKENSLVNGASFNYAHYNDYNAKKSKEDNHRQSNHYRLDIEVGEALDPSFRKNAFANAAINSKVFRAPTRTEYSERFRKSSDANKEIFNKLANI